MGELVIVIMIVGLFVACGGFKKLTSFTSETNSADIEEFKKQTICLLDHSLNYQKRMEHYIDVYCNFSLVFDNRTPYMLLSAMVRDDFAREFGRIYSIERLAHGNLSFYGDKYKMEEFLKMTSFTMHSSNFITHKYDFPASYNVSECKKWFVEYVKANYPNYQVE